MFDFGVLLVCVPNISSTHVNAGGEDLVKRLLTEYFASTVSTVLVELNLEDLWERRRWQFWWIGATTLKIINVGVGSFGGFGAFSSSILDVVGGSFGYIGALTLENLYAYRR
jgi:hypothetical protein